MTTLPHRLDRTVVIRAPRQTVFRFFTDVERWAAWWGKGSTIDAKPGGRVRIVYPGGTEVAGEVVEIAQPDRIVFTYGYVKGVPAIPPGGSRVTIRLEPHHDGTQVNLTHELHDAALRDEHVQGWRYQLSLFANVVTDDFHAGVTDTVDGWFAAWAEVDAAKRKTALAAIASPGLQFADKYSVTAGHDDVLAQLAAYQQFMPGMRLERQHAIRHCQGRVLADWVAVAKDGTERGRGTNLFVLDASGKIESIVGFWGAAV